MIAQALLAKSSFYLSSDSEYFFTGIATKFNHQNSTWVALYEETVLCLLAIVFGTFQNIMVNQLTGTGFKSNCQHIGTQRFVYRIKMYTK